MKTFKWVYTVQSGILYDSKDTDIIITVSFEEYTFTEDNKNSISGALILANIPDPFDEGIPKGLYISKDPQ